MTFHHLIELSLFVFVCLLWKYNQDMHEETKEWQNIVEEYCKR